jgi:hypothetical protein
MAQLTYQQAKALRSKIVEKIEELSIKKIKERQSKYDNDPAHKEINQLTSKIEAMQRKRSALLKGIKKRNGIDSYISESSTKSFKFKNENLVSATTRSSILDDLTIYTIGSNNGKADPNTIIDKFVTKYLV